MLFLVYINTTGTFRPSPFTPQLILTPMSMGEADVSEAIRTCLFFKFMTPMFLETRPPCSPTLMGASPAYAEDGFQRVSSPARVLSSTWPLFVHAPVKLKMGPPTSLLGL